MWNAEPDLTAHTTMEPTGYRSDLKPPKLRMKAPMTVTASTGMQKSVLGLLYLLFAYDT